MTEEVVILLAEDDEGHAGLIRKNLERAGLANELLHFRDGQAVLEFLMQTGSGPVRQSGKAYVLLLDMRMPKLSGIQVLEELKKHPELRKIPVVVITTTDDPREVAACHALGCSSYITKPLEYEKFVQAIRQLGLYLAVVTVPTVNGAQ